MPSVFLTDCPTCNQGQGFYGITVAETDGSPSYSGLNKINFNSNDFYITQNSPNTDEVIVNFRGTVAAGSGEANTASNLGAGEGVFAQKVGVDLQFKSLVAGTGITLIPSSTDITINSTSTGGGGGFYGVLFEDGIHFFQKDHLSFNNSDFYLTADAQGHPVVNLQLSLRTDVPRSVVQTFGLSSEWQLGHNLGSSIVLWDTFDDQGEAVIPDKVDSSNPNITFFYFVPPTSGSAIVASGIADGISISTGSFYGITVAETDGTHSYSGLNKLNFFSDDFYITQNIPNTDEVTIALKNSLKLINESGSVINIAAAVLPSTDLNLDLGSSARKFDDVFCRRIQARTFVGPNTDVVTGGSVFGYTNSAPSRAFFSNSGLGAFINGYISATGSNSSSIVGSGKGSFTSGAVSNSSSSTAYLSNLGDGAFVVGSVNGTSGGRAQVSTAAAGGFASGNVLAITSNAGVVSFNTGFAQGNAVSLAAGTAYITASASGSFAQGRVQVGSISAAAYGSHARGNVSTGSIAVAANAHGSYAGGYAKTNGNISVSAGSKGAWAFGYTSGGNIQANANNAMQFGPGVNAIANTVQIGTGAIILRGNSAVDPGGIKFIGALDHDGGTVGFFYHIPVSQRKDCFYLNVAYTATTDGSLVDVGVVPTQVDINNNFAELAAKVNRIRDALRDLGLMGPSKN